MARVTQKQVMDLVALDMHADRIAAKLGTTPGNVRRHIRNWADAKLAEDGDLRAWQQRLHASRKGGR